MMRFTSPGQGKMSLEEVVNDILNFISAEINYNYKLMVGSDSHPRMGETCFVTAIIIHRLGRGAKYYFSKETLEWVGSIPQRIFHEASLSLDLAENLTLSLKEHGRSDMPVEVHLDVGNQGITRDLIKDVVGMIAGSGFDAKIKPYACAASSVADKYTR